MKNLYLTTSMGLFILLVLTYRVSAQSVGIGVNQPNPNAVLELVSPTNNQGLMIPKVSTAQRNANSFVSKLSNKENGLMVFDSDENAFYYWQNGSWQSIASNVILTAGDGIQINGNLITNIGDLDQTNELQQISLTGTVLTLSDGGSVDLNSINTDNQLTEQQIAAFGFVKLNDLSISDNQNISLTGMSLTIERGNTIDLSSLDTNTQLTDSDIAAMGYLKTASDDQTAGEVGVMPSGDLTSTDVQSALEELQGEITTAASASLPDGAVTTVKISNGAVTNAKITGMDFAKLTNVPAGLADGDDNTQLTESEVDGYVSNNGYLTTETDPSVPASIKDGIDWSELSGIPADIADGDANTQLTDSDIAAMGYLKTASDDQTAGEVGVLPSGDLTSTDVQSALEELQGEITTAASASLPDGAVTTVKISNGAVTNAKITGMDFAKLTNVPAGLADGDDNTQLTESEVDGYVSNNGYLTTETDPSVPASIKDGIDWSELSGIPADIADGDANTQLTDSDIAAMGYLKTASDDQTAGEVGVLPSGDLTSTDVQSALEELQGEITTAASASLPDGAVTTVKISNGAVTNAKITGMDFAKLTNVPAGLADGDDNTQLTESEVDGYVSNNGYLTTETDPSVPASIKDGIDWSELSGIPADIADGDANTQLTDSDIAAMGYLKTASDDQTAGEVGVLPSGDLTSTDVQSALEELQGEITTAASASLPDGAVTTVKISNGAVTNAKITGMDFAKLTNVPAGLADGDDNTQLTESEVDGYVSNNGYLTTETDPSVPASIKDGIDWSELSGIPADIADGDDNTQLTDSDIAAMGYLKTASDDQTAGEVGVMPSGDLTSTDVQSALEELQGEITTAASASLPDGAVTTVKISNGAVTNAKITGMDFAKLTNVPAGLADGDDNTQLTESEVDGYVSNNGYLTTETDPSVPASIKDGIDWSELSGIPTDIADGDDNTQLSMVEIAALGFITSPNDADASSSNELITSAVMSGNVLRITEAATTTNVDLSQFAELPSQSSQGGKYLTTNGVSASWATVPSSLWNLAGSSINYTAGNVSIGTALGSSRLNVQTSTANSTTPQISISDGNGTGDASINFLQTSGGSYAIGLDASDADKFKISASGIVGTNDVLTALSTGQVGIGVTASTDTQLEVLTSNAYGIQLNNNANAGTVNGLRTNITGGTSGTVYGVYSDITALGSGQRHAFYGYTRTEASNSNLSYGMRLNVDADGNGAAYGAYISMLGSGTGNNFGLFINNGSAGINEYGIYTTGEGRNFFSGDLGIGTTTPSEKLDVIGNVEITGTIVTPVRASVYNINTTNYTLTVPVGARIIKVQNTANNGTPVRIAGITPGIDGQELIIVNVDPDAQTINGRVDFLTSYDFDTNKLYLDTNSGNVLIGPDTSMLKLIYIDALSAWVQESFSSNSKAVIF
ncbi:hypothetical protein N6H18_09685 [Reichenbachiella agarivorans]|uniref:Uncharacterized protein n=1 Tax=Reichenbachiella agarivorans TaxID=2979464 RepID=A0ABY6CKL6_9BACT|nr:hypothetical protein [Reichenbachiella agarivorans]UXP30625.1 hypothetical protein N6H18_09685 [Reichenbachiella agarivorans]